jgi:hypothetical protein
VNDRLLGFDSLLRSAASTPFVARRRRSCHGLRLLQGFGHAPDGQMP